MAESKKKKEGDEFDSKGSKTGSLPRKTETEIKNYATVGHIQGKPLTVSETLARGLNASAKVLEPDFKPVTARLNGLTKTGIQLVNHTNPEPVARLSGDYNYVTLFARLYEFSLKFATERVKIPFYSDSIEAAISSLFDKSSSDYRKTWNFLVDNISRLADTYHAGLAQRSGILEDVMIRLKDSSLGSTQITREDDAARLLESLRKDLEFVLLDGMKKSVRDTFGRTIPIDESLAYDALIAETASTVATASQKNIPFISFSSHKEFLLQLASLEKRAVLSTGDHARSQLLSSAAALTAQAKGDPAVALLTKNRMEFILNSGTDLVEVSMGDLTSAFSANVITLSKAKVQGPVAVAEVDLPLLTSSIDATALEQVRIQDVIEYALSSLFLSATSSTISDIITQVGLPAEKDLIALVQQGSVQDQVEYQEVIQAVHEYFYLLNMSALMGHSYSTPPNYDLKLLSSLQSMTAASRTVEDIEPVLIALDGIRQCYVQALKQTFEFFRGTYQIPSATTIAKLSVIKDTEYSSRYAIVSDPDTFIHDMTDKAMKTVTEGMKRSMDLDSAWSLNAYDFTSAERLVVLNGDKLISVESFIDQDVDVMLLSQEESNDLKIAGALGVTGSFRVTPYLSFSYKYDSSLIDKLSGMVTLDEYETLATAMEELGLPRPEAVKVERLQGDELTMYRRLKGEITEEENEDDIARMALTVLHLPHKLYLIPVLSEVSQRLSNHKELPFSPYAHVFQVVLDSFSDMKPVKAGRVGAEAIGLIMRRWPVSAATIKVAAEIVDLDVSNKVKEASLQLAKELAVDELGISDTEIKSSLDKGVTTVE